MISDRTFGYAVGIAAQHIAANNTEQYISMNLVKVVIILS